MLKDLIKCAGVTGVCVSAVAVSISFINKDNGPIQKVSFDTSKKTVSEITKLEDIDAWGKENGCNFMFINDWTNKEIYNAIAFAEVNGGKEKMETVMVQGVNKFKQYCKENMKTFSFQYNEWNNELYISDPNVIPTSILEQHPDIFLL